MIVWKSKKTVNYKKILKISGFILIGFIFIGIFIFFSYRNKTTLVFENKESKIDNDLGEEVLDLNKNIDVGEESSGLVENVIDDKEEIKKTTEVVSSENVVNSSVTLAEEEFEVTKSPEKSIKIDNKIKERLVSWGFSKSSERKIDTIIIHSSYNILGGDEYDLDKTILEYKQYGVSPHYVIDRKGDIFRLVQDNNIAYHAGVSKIPDGRTGVNDFSIGIELLNTEKDEFTKNQYNSVNYLIAILRRDYKIKYILGHNQIAPERKTDPWNMDWNKIDK